MPAGSASPSARESHRQALRRYGVQLMAMADEMNPDEDEQGDEPLFPDEPTTDADEDDQDSQYIRRADLLGLLRELGVVPAEPEPEMRSGRAVHQRSARALLRAFDDYLDPALDDLDEDSRVLYLALAHLDEHGTSGAPLVRFDPGQPRYPKGHPKGGKFRPTVGAVIESLVKWQKGETDPFPSFRDEQLIKVAKGRGIDVPADADRAEITKRLLADFESKEVARERPNGVDEKSWRTLQTLAGGDPSTVTSNELPGLMDAIAAAKPPAFNLAKVQVTGGGNENLFRKHLSNEKRKTMPQLPTETGPDLDRFEAFLRSSGVGFAYGRTDPRRLTATQSELSGPKVAKLFGFMRDGGWKKGGVLIMSRDGAVIDGHHRWAAAAAASVARGGTLEVDTMVLDLDWKDALAAVKPFAKFEDLATDREAAANA